jgi:acyl dehydratase
MRVFDSVAALKEAVGEHLGHSDWHPVSQERVDAFADATGDHQWIHVDPAAAARGPFGTTIAHGYLMLSMIPMLAAEVSRVEGVRMGINYGLNRVRFPAPLPTGSPLRAGIRLLSVDDVAGGVQVVSEVTLERDGGDKPCCVAETVSRYYTAEP